MPEFSAALPTLIGFALSMILLYVLSRQISLQLQAVIYLVTRSIDMATVGLFLVLLPGIFVHESAHWLMARMLGLRTGKFRVWPQRQGKMIGMGQVTVEQGGVVRDSLVGMAPLLAGSVIVALIGRHIFAVDPLAGLLYDGDLRNGLNVFLIALRTRDSALWAYLLFAAANAMMPSASDREPLLPLLLYLGLAVLIYVFLGMPLDPFSAALDWLLPPLQNLTSGLVFALLLDAIVLAILTLLTLLFSSPRRGR